MVNFYLGTAKGNLLLYNHQTQRYVIIYEMDNSKNLFIKKNLVIV